VFPALALIMASPITSAVMTSAYQGGVPLLLAGPTLLAVAAGPGYLYALGRWRYLASYSSAKRWWIRASFAIALGASLLGAVIGLAFILPSVAAALTAIADSGRS
jgi:hypothetical protein